MYREQGPAFLSCFFFPWVLIVCLGLWLLWPGHNKRSFFLFWFVPAEISGSYTPEIAPVLGRCFNDGLVFRLIPPQTLRRSILCRPDALSGASSPICPRGTQNNGSPTRSLFLPPSRPPFRCLLDVLLWFSSGPAFRRPRPPPFPALDCRHVTSLIFYRTFL